MVWAASEPCDTWHVTQEDSGDDVTRDARDRGEQEDTMGIRMQDRDREVFVIVNYDFEYITEDGKEVWMKEGEILLLLSRTNNDWWQVCLKVAIISVIPNNQVCIHAEYGVDAKHLMVYLLMRMRPGRKFCRWLCRVFSCGPHRRVETVGTITLRYFHFPLLGPGETHDNCGVQSSSSSRITA